MLESYLGPSYIYILPARVPFSIWLGSGPPTTPSLPPDLHDLVETTLADDLLVPNEKSSVFNRVRARSPQNSRDDPPYPPIPDYTSSRSGTSNIEFEE